MSDLPTLTKFDARVFLGVSKNTIDRMMKRGELPYFKRGRRVFFSEDDLRSVYKRKAAKGDST